MTGTAVAERLREIESRIAAACERSDREPQSITLVGAGKRQPIDKLLQAHEAGLRIFGENRVQEAAAKVDLLPDSVEWHLLGPLQSNKARRAAALFDFVHSVDRVKIARALDREATGLGRVLSGFLEVNLGAETSKHGFSPERLPDQVAPLSELASLRVVGLMAIPPREETETATRAWFRRLRELGAELFERPEWSGSPGWLSMGMSADFEIAIEEGATHVRVGTSLFGPRP